MSNDYLDLSSLKDVAEPLPGGPIQSEDFTRSSTMPVGTYVSHTRSITAKKRDDGHISFAITFDGGLLFTENGKVYGEKYPLKKWVTTVPFKVERDGAELAGTTSSAADYLKAVGLNPKGLNTIAEVVEAMVESESMPVGVFVGRTDRRVKADNGTWSGGDLKTKDFKGGTNEAGDPVYLEQIEKDGKTYRAAPVVTSFQPAA